MSDECGSISFLAEARSGGQTALSRLALLVRERLYPFLLHTTRDRDATEDVLQDTLLTMLRRLPSLRDNERFWPWIYRIAWNKVQDRLRDRRQRSLYESAVRRGPDGGGYSYRDSNPLEAQVRAESLQQVCAAISQLNRQQRDILQLRCYDDLPYTEIAALTRTTPDKARVRFHRAKRSLRARLTTCGV
ncbi:MAG: sigma-70 family RNA polymerase sigma factor [Planctomycetes bacterium]|nr:sigma-70 family RNA polymerase sigma factor [Planctomycetota bacterium]